MDLLRKFVNLPFNLHISLGIIIRFCLIIYADYHDRVYDVPYTDIDYKVFTDAARHVVHGSSPYKRHTYRYSPIIAYLMVPNVLVGKDFGKILFSAFDILLAIAAKKLVKSQIVGIKNKDHRSKISEFCALFWLYNPLCIGISTRGNADSFPCFVIIMSLLFLQSDIIKSSTKYIISGILLGIAIHLRLYPVAFSFPMYLSLGDYSINRSVTVQDAFLSLLPNKNQLILAFSCTSTVLLLTYGMYVLYGYEFLFETYIFHLFRQDIKHNFSVLFYYSYLTLDQPFELVKPVCQIFEVFILFMLSLSYGCDPKTLPFALFTQAIVLVSYNSVVTSQYFVWFLSLLPLIVQDLRLTKHKSVLLCLIWFLSQGAWLFYAYLLEFKGREVFILVWLKGAIFFCSNVFILCNLINAYYPGYAFGYKGLLQSKKFK